MKNIKKIFVLMIILIMNKLCAEIPITQIKEFATPLRKNFQHLSPIHGTLLWKSHYPENLYRLGWQNGPSTSSAVRLAKELFHLHHDEVTFDRTYLKTKIASHFSPYFVGKVIGHIENFKHKYANYLTSEQHQKRIRGGGRLSPTSFIELPDVSEIKEKIRQEIETLEEQIDPAIKSEILYKSSRKDFVRHLITAFTEQTPFHGSVGGIEYKAPIAYIPHNVTSLLLAFLWKKASTKTDFLEYFKGLKETIIESPFTDDAFITREENSSQFLNATLDESNYDQLRKATKEEIEQDIISDIEKLAFSYLAFFLYESTLPDPITMVGNALYQGITFPDCGESSIRNFLNALLYNRKIQEFDVEILKEIKVSQTLIAFYEKYKTPEKINTEQASNDWTNVVSGLKNVNYLQEEKCEINAGTKNMLAVLQEILQLQEATFDALVKKFSGKIKIEYYPKKDILVPEHDTNNEIGFNITKNDNPPMYLNWKFKTKHFVLEYPPISRMLQHAGRYKTTLTKILLQKTPIYPVPLVIILSAYDASLDTQFLSETNLDPLYEYFAQLIKPTNNPENLGLLIKTLIESKNKIPENITRKLIRRLYSMIPQQDWNFQYFVMNLILNAPLAIFDPEAPEFKNMSLIGKFSAVQIILEEKIVTFTKWAQENSLAPALAQVQSKNIGLRQAAFNTLTKLMESGIGQEEIKALLIDIVTKKNWGSRWYTLDLLKRFVTKGELFNEALTAASALIDTQYEDEKIVALKVFEALVEQNQSLEIAQEKAIEYSTIKESLNDHEDPYQKQYYDTESASIAIIILSKLVEKGRTLEQAMRIAIQSKKTADKLKLYDNHTISSLLYLFAALVRKDRAINDAIAVANEYASLIYFKEHESIIKSALQLFQALFEKNRGFEEAENLLKNKNLSQNLLQQLKALLTKYKK